MLWYAHARVTGLVRPGRRGDWAVEEFDTTITDLPGQLPALYYTGRYVPPGRYTRLLHRGRVVMSDTPDELRDLGAVLRRARGRVLVHGLGLGCLVKALLALPAVRHIDVVECEAEVIDLVAGYYAGDRCTIHHGDAVTYPWPIGARWDVVWHDIWPDLRLQHLLGMALLERRFRGRCGWQGSWGKAYLLRALASRVDGFHPTSSPSPVAVRSRDNAEASAAGYRR